MKEKMDRINKGREMFEMEEKYMNMGYKVLFFPNPPA